MSQILTIKEQFLKDELSEQDVIAQLQKLPLKEYQEGGFEMSPDEAFQWFQKSESKEMLAGILTLIEKTFEDGKSDHFNNIANFFDKLDTLDKKEGSAITWVEVMNDIVLFGNELFKQLDDNKRLEICKAVDSTTFTSILLPIILENDMDALVVKLIDNHIVEANHFTDSFLERHNIHERSEKLYEEQTGDKAIRIESSNTTTEEINLFD